MTLSEAWLRLPTNTLKQRLHSYQKIIETPNAAVSSYFREALPDFIKELEAEIKHREEAA